MIFRKKRKTPLQQLLIYPPKKWGLWKSSPLPRNFAQATRVPNRRGIAFPTRNHLTRLLLPRGHSFARSGPPSPSISVDVLQEEDRRRRGHRYEVCTPIYPFCRVFVDALDSIAAVAATATGRVAQPPPPPLGLQAHRGPACLHMATA
jgi:hypothetical protein